MSVPRTPESKPELVNLSIHPAYQKNGEPSAIQTLPPPPTEVTIGDLHGNALKLIFVLIKEGVLDLPKDCYDYFVDIYNADPINKDKVNFFQQHILPYITLKPGAEITKIRLIGDELADRGGNDYFTLKILQKLKQLLPRNALEIIISNHGTGFLKYYHFLKNKNPAYASKFRQLLIEKVKGLYDGKTKEIIEAEIKALIDKQEALSQQISHLCNSDPEYKKHKYDGWDSPAVRKLRKQQSDIGKDLNVLYDLIKDAQDVLGHGVTQEEVLKILSSEPKELSSIGYDGEGLIGSITGIGNTDKDANSLIQFMKLVHSGAVDIAELERIIEHDYTDSLKLISYSFTPPSHGKNPDDFRVYSHAPSGCQHIRRLYDELKKVGKIPVGSSFDATNYVEYKRSIDEINNGFKILLKEQGDIGLCILICPEIREFMWRRPDTLPETELTPIFAGEQASFSVTYVYGHDSHDIGEVRGCKLEKTDNEFGKNPKKNKKPQEYLGVFIPGRLALSAREEKVAGAAPSPEPTIPPTIRRDAEEDKKAAEAFAVRAAKKKQKEEAERARAIAQAEKERASIKDLAERGKSLRRVDEDKKGTGKDDKEKEKARIEQAEREKEQKKRDEELRAAAEKDRVRVEKERKEQAERERKKPDEKKGPLPKPDEKKGALPKPEDKKVALPENKICLRAYQELKEIKDSSVIVSAPKWVREALAELSKEIFKDKTSIEFNIYSDKAGTKQVGKVVINAPLDLKSLIMLARNETENTTGIIKEKFFDGLGVEKKSIYALKDLVRHCVIVGKDKAKCWGGYPVGTEVHKHEPPIDVYLCDLSGLQFQQPHNTGRLVLISPDTLPAGSLDDMIYRNTVGKDEKKATFADCEKDKTNRYRKVFFHGKPVYFDTFAYKQFVKQDFEQAALALNDAAKGDPKGRANFKFLSYGTGFFAEGLGGFADPTKSQDYDTEKVPRQKFLEEYLLQGVYESLKLLLESKAIPNIKQIELPFYENTTAQAIKLIEDLCKEYNIDCVRKRQDALKDTRPDLALATTNCSDPHVLSGNEMRLQSVDAAIALNLVNHGDTLSPFVNPDMRQQFRDVAGAEPVKDSGYAITRLGATPAHTPPPAHSLPKPILSTTTTTARSLDRLRTPGDGKGKAPGPYFTEIVRETIKYNDTEDLKQKLKQRVSGLIGKPFQYKPPKLELESPGSLVVPASDEKKEEKEKEITLVVLKGKDYDSDANKQDFAVYTLRTELDQSKQAISKLRMLHTSDQWTDYERQHVQDELAAQVVADFLSKKKNKDAAIRIGGANIDLKMAVAKYCFIHKIPCSGVTAGEVGAYYAAKVRSASAETKRSDRKDTTEAESKMPVTDPLKLVLGPPAEYIEVVKRYMASKKGADQRGGLIPSRDNRVVCFSEHYSDNDAFSVMYDCSKLADEKGNIPGGIDIEGDKFVSALHAQIFLELNENYRKLQEDDERKDVKSKLKESDHKAWREMLKLSGSNCSVSTLMKAYDDFLEYIKGKNQHSEVDNDKIFEKIMFAKFSQFPQLKHLLLETKDAEIIYINDSNKKYGFGKEGGKNELGMHLMKLRGQLLMPAVREVKEVKDKRADDPGMGLG